MRSVILSESGLKDSTHPITSAPIIKATAKANASANTNVNLFITIFPNYVVKLSVSL